MMAHIDRSPNATLTSNHDWQRTRIRKEGYMRRSLLRWLSGAALLSCLCQPGIAADKVSLMVGGIEKQIYSPPSWQTALVILGSRDSMSNCLPTPRA